MGVALLLSYEFSQGLLSPRMLGLALLILRIGLGVGAVLLGEFGGRKLVSSLMGAVLVLGLTQIRNFPVLPLRVDLAVNLLTTAISVRTVVRLQKILR